MFFVLHLLLVICTLKANGSILHAEKHREKSTKTFPKQFLFGASSAAYQIEGGWNEGGKGWSMWDHLVRTDPGHIKDRANGDVAANSYHLYKRDVQMLDELGVGVYRFSISWPRILPYGRPDYINPEGITYYNNLINELLANNILPCVTIYHWDLPQNLNEQGGWLNENIVDWLGDYSRVLFENFGDRVKYWITVNEPNIHCQLGYGEGVHAPRIRSPGVGYYECGRNILLAHAKVYHIYDKEFRATQRGSIGITMDSEMAIPSSDSPDDIQAVQDYLDFRLGQYAHPIFTPNGNYPQRLISLVAEASERQGLNASRLRPFTQEQIDTIKGASDFFGLNHYSSIKVYRNESVVGMHEIPSSMDDAQIGTYEDPSWPTAPNGSTRIYAPGLRKLLLYIKNTYNDPLIFITENGFSTSTAGLNDTMRADYYRQYLNSVLEAIDKGVKMIGYCAWSLMDSFEWTFGYSIRLGLYEIDHNDPEKKRTARYSALVYKEIIRSRYIDPSYNPNPYTNDNN